MSGTSACENTVTLQVDNAPPDNIECPQFSLSAAEAEQCSEATIVPSGCPATGQIIWEEATTTGGSESYKVKLNKEKTIKATCITQYGQKVTSAISLTPVPVQIEVNPGEVYAGMKAILRATGCYNGQCGEGSYKWERAGQNAVLGKSVEVKLLADTDFKVTCVESGASKSVTIKVKAPDCNYSYSSFPNGNSTHAEINASWCDTQYPINWFISTSVWTSNGWQPSLSEFTAGRNRRKVSVQRPADTTPPSGFTDTYTVSCVREGTDYPCNFIFSVDSPYLFNQYGSKSTLSGTGTTEPANTPDPCNEFEFIEKGAFDSPRGASYASLYSDWCPGTKVEWFYDGKKLGELVPPREKYYLGEVSTSNPYLYKCYLSGGKVCEGEYKFIVDNPMRIGTPAAATSTIIDQQCSSTVSLATVMAVYYSQMLCQDVNLYKGDKTKSEEYLDLLLNSTKEKPIGALIKLPTNTDDIVNEMEKGNCEVAGKLLASANGVQAVPIGDANNLIANYQTLHDSIKEASKIPFSIHLQAFAPFDTFGFGFEGDGENRRIGNNRQRYRLYSAMSLQYQGSNFVAISKIKTIPANSSWFGNNSQPSETISVVDLNNSSIPRKANLQILAFAGNDATMQKDINNYMEKNYNTDIGILTDMNIDRHLTLSMEMVQFGKNIQILKLSGTLDGEFFPATDLYITDRNNNSITLGGAAAKIDMKIGVCSICNCEAKNCAPFSHLGKSPYKNFDISLSVKIENGIFTKVIDNFGVEWKILDWNNSWLDKSTVIILPK